MYNRYLNGIKSLIGNYTTTTTQLNRTGVQLFGKKYKGTHSAAIHMTVPRMLMQFGDCCILNTSSKMPGEHWVAFARGKKQMYAYDSFGRHVSGLASDADMDAEQAILESNCGQRCLAWLMVFNKHGEDVAKLI